MEHMRRLLFLYIYNNNNDIHCSDQKNTVPYKVCVIGQLVSLRKYTLLLYSRAPDTVNPENFHK